MSAPTEKPGGWRSTPVSGQSVSHRWRPDHSPAGSGRLSVKKKRAVFGLLTLACAAVIGWLFSLPWGQNPITEVATFGISEYQYSPPFPRNQFGETDALAFRALPGHSQNFHIFESPNKLTGGEMLNSLKGDLTGKNLIVFCSLHGRLTPDAAASGLTAEFYGITANGTFDIDAGGDESGRKMLSVPDLLERLKQTRARHILLLIEAGQLQPSWPLGVLANDITAHIAADVQNAAAPNLCVLCSAGPHEVSHTAAASPADRLPGQKSGEGDPAATTAASEPATAAGPADQSVFAHFVLEGLKGRADGWGPATAADNREVSYFARQHRPDNLIDPEELHAYVAQQVAEWVAENAGRDVHQTVTKLVSSNYKKSDIALVPHQGRMKKAVASKTTPDKSAAEAKAAEAKAAPKKAASPSVARQAAPPSTKSGGPSEAVEPAIFAQVLADKADDQKKSDELNKALDAAFKGSSTHQKSQQQVLARWLIKQALREGPGKATFNAQPLLKQIKDLDESEKPVEFELLRRLLALEQTAAALQWPSVNCRQALQARQRAEGLIRLVPPLKPHLVEEARTALRAITAAERWLLVSSTNGETLELARKWYNKFEQSLKAIDEGTKDLTAATKLTQELQKTLGDLAKRTADVAEQSENPPNWAQLGELADWMGKNADQIPLPAILDCLPETKEKSLLKLMRSASQLERLLERPPEAAELQRQLAAVSNEWNRVSIEQPTSPAPVNPRMAGVWQGFWAIETLRYRARWLPERERAELSVLWGQWKQIIVAAARDDLTEEAREAQMRLQRVVLGAMIQKWWEKTSKPPLPSDGSDPIPDNRKREIHDLWTALRAPDDGTATHLQFQQVDGSSTGREDRRIRLEEFVLETATDKKSQRDGAKLKVTIAAPPDADRGPLKLAVWGSNLVSLNQKSLPVKPFDLASMTELTLNVGLEKTLQKQSVLAALVESGPDAEDWEFPVEIRRLRVDPPFDPSLWKIVFKTENEVAAHQADIVGQAKLWLPPSATVTLFPWLVGPLLPDVDSVEVKAYRLPPEDDKSPASDDKKWLITEFKSIGLKVTGGEPTTADRKASASLKTSEWKLEPSVSAAATAAPAAAVPPPAAPQLDDVSNGLKFVITPRGLPPVTYFVPIILDSAEAYIQKPEVEFKNQQIQISLKRETFDALQQPLRHRDIPVVMLTSPELALLEGGKTIKNAVLKPDDDPASLSVLLKAQEGALTNDKLRFSLSVAGRPHAYHWKILPEPPHLLDAPKDEVRIVSPVPSIAYMREGDKLMLQRDGKASPAQIDLRIEVDSQDIDRLSVPGRWKLDYELRDSSNNPPRNKKSWPVASTLNKSVQLAINEGAWKLTTAVSDFTHEVPTDGLNGRFQLVARLSNPDGVVVASDSMQLVIDRSPPDEPRFDANLPEKHAVETALKFRVEVDDPDSGIYQVIAGVDTTAPFGTLEEGERLKPIANPGSPIEITIDQNHLPQSGGTFSIIVMATNNTQGQFSKAVSQPITFLPRVLPKETTTGTLRVILGNAQDGNTLTFEGPSPLGPVDFGQGQKEQEFKNLDPGEYKISVLGYNYKGEWKGKVVANQVTTANVKMVNR